MNSLLVTLSTAILLAATPPSSSALAPPPPQSSSVVAGDFAEELAMFDAAMIEWETKLDSTDDRKAKRALQKAHPAANFYATMSAHFVAKEVQAAYWLLENLRDLGLSRKDREALRATLYDTLISDPDAMVRRSALEQMMADSSFTRAVSSSGLEQRVSAYIKLEDDPELRGLALYLLGSKFAQSREEDVKGRGLEILKGLLEDQSHKPEAERSTLSGKNRKSVEKLIFASEHLVVGAMAPEFTGKSIDGEPIALTDTRGKVTVLQFFGFW